MTRERSAKFEVGVTEQSTSAEAQSFLPGYGRVASLLNTRREEIE
uniref:Uncharacterized protein n=1 Tax=Anguilla anguilla TaxID=7936 RepID=A0A0E9UM28_ANGAN